MRLRAAHLCLLILAWGALRSVGASAAEGKDKAKELPPPAQRMVKFEADIQPLLARYCYDCHGPDKQESSYRLDRKEIALKGGDLEEAPIVPGKSAESPLVRYVAGIDSDLTMPPKGARLTAEEVGLVRAWIDQGATWAEGGDSSLKLTTTHWSFQPLKPVAVPNVQHPHAAGNPIDAFIVEKLTTAGLSPAGPADRPTLIRRLYFDMLGLPPTPAEIQAFVDDREANAYDKLIEHVLASPRYGERWARHWLDVVRFAETNGFETNVERPNAWHYRDYVIDALNNDKPYDKFVFEQLAGDSVGQDAATGFLVGGPWDQVKSPDPVLTAMQRSDELSDITNTTATTFLAMTVGCAKCHNHKFDPILQKDYFALQAVFAGVQHGDRASSTPQSPESRVAAEKAQQRLIALKQEIDALQSHAPRGRVVTIDDEALANGEGSVGVTLLATKRGHGINPDGGERGRKADAGDFDRFPNVSRGRYTWWDNKPGEDVMAYRPALKGRHRAWLSWGCGYLTHTKDAQYVLDLDGNVATKDDQTIIATIDQQQFAEGAGKTPEQPLWSGFVSGGVHDYKPESIVLVRGGKTGTALTADVVVFEAMPPGEVAAADEPAQPPLRLAVNSRENVEQFAPHAVRHLRFTVRATNNGSEPCIDELEVYSAPTAGQPARNVAITTGVKLTSSGNFAGSPFHRLEHLNDGKLGNSFSWISNTAGRGWVEIEFPETVTIDRIVWGRDREEQYRDRTPTDYVIEAALEPGKWLTVATSTDRLPADAMQAASPQLAFLGLTKQSAARGKALFSERRELEEKLKSLTSSQMVYAGRFERPGETHRLFRGDPMQPREVVAPDCLTVIGTLGLSNETAEQQRRVALAKWIADPANPLTARVMVNRVWQHHFGTGIVDTPSDFGKNGTPPSHPQLLDWLAGQFIKDGWSLKELHRLILRSNTYRQANQSNEAGMKVDAQCRLLWRYPPHRLEAETIRDAILATSGALDLKMGGPGWSTFKPNSNYVRFYEPKEEFGPSEFRRAIYMTKVRMRQDGVFGTFDCPDAGQIAPKRARSTTALQALSLFNSQFILQQSEKLAARVQSEAGEKPADQVQKVFQLTLGRTPDAEESIAAQGLVKEHGLPALCRAVYNANEFLFLP
jgi:hypothetical protein